MGVNVDDTDGRRREKTVGTVFRLTFTSSDISTSSNIIPRQTLGGGITPNQNETNAL